MKFLGAVLSQDEQYLAFHRTPGELEVVAVATMETCVYRTAKQRNILGYHWLSPSLLSDFVLVTAGSIDFFKLQDRPLRLQSVKSHSFPTSQYWFDPKSGTLALAHNASKPGLLRTFHCYQDKAAKFDGVKFTLVGSVPTANVWATQFPNSMSLVTLQPSEETHKCVLAKIYDAVYFLHFATASGLLQLYSITPEAVTLLPTAITRSADTYNLYTIDNLIVIQCPRLREEYYYDIKAPKFNTAPFAVLKSPAVDRSNGLEDAYCTALLRADQDVLVDTREGRCYRVDLSAGDLASLHQQLSAALMFLLRRAGGKFEAFARLKGALLAQVPLKAVSEFFVMSSKAYRTVALEKQSATVKRMPTGGLDTQVSMGFEADLRAEWVAVMLQSEMQTLVLQDLCNDESLPPLYVTGVLLEYQRSLVAQEIHVNLSVQLMIVRQLIHARNYVLLQSMLQFRALMDCREIAEQLVTLGSGTEEACYRPALQLGVDMLFRLKAYADLAKILVDRGLVYEVLVCLDTEALPTEALQSIESVLSSQPEYCLLVRSFLAQRKSAL